MSTVDNQTGAWLRRLPLLILGLALLLRIAYLISYAQEFPQYQTPLVDAKIYERWARTILDGDFWSWGEGVFYRAPLYPYLLAGLLAVFGKAMPGVALFQMLLGIGTLGLIGLLSRRLGGTRAAVFSILLLALYGPMIATESKLLGTSLGLFLHALSLYLIVRFLEHPSDRRGLVAGLVLGLSVLVRPLWILLVVIFPLVHLDRPSVRGAKDWFRRWMPFGVAVLLLLAPVTLRNRIIGDDWVLISSNGGMTLFQGNNIENRSGLLTVIQRLQLSGSAEQQRELEARVAGELTGHEMRPSETSRFWAGQALEFMTGNAGAWLRLEAMKVYRYVTSFEYGDNYSYYAERERLWPLQLAFLPFGFLLSIGIFGLVVLRGRDPVWRVAAISVGIGVFGCLAFYVSSRYRMEAVPALALLGGVALARLTQGGIERGARLWIAAGLSALLLLASFLPAGAPARSQESISYLHLGNAFEDQGRDQDARDAYGRAAELLPRNPFAWQSYLLAESRVAGLESAYLRLGEVPAEIRDYPQLLYTQGYLAAGTGRTEEAIAALQSAVAEQPLMREAHRRLAGLLVSEGRYEEAEPVLVEAIELGPRSPDLLAKLGYVRLQVGKHEEARSIYRELLDLRPEDPDAGINFAIASFHTGRLEEAEQVLGRILSGRPGDPGDSGDSGDPGDTLADGSDPLALYYRGLLQLRRREFGGAIDDLGRVLAARAADHRALYYRDLARAGLGHLATNPDWIEPWAALYGPEILPGRVPLSRWLTLRAQAGWGSALGSEELLVWQELRGLVEPSRLLEGLATILEEEGVGPPY